MAAPTANLVKVWIERTGFLSNEAERYPSRPSAPCLLVPLGVGLFLAARFAPLVRTTVGWWLGVAAAAVPALLMQLFCMYEPWHGLTHHLLPIAAVAALGALAGRALLPRY